MILAESSENGQYLVSVEVRVDDHIIDSIKSVLESHGEIIRLIVVDAGVTSPKPQHTANKRGCVENGHIFVHVADASSIEQIDQGFIQRLHGNILKY